MYSGRRGYVKRNTLPSVTWTTRGDDKTSRPAHNEPKRKKSKSDDTKDTKLGSAALPLTHLGTYIETRVNNFLKKKKAGAGKVSIRVVSSSDKSVKVKPEMKNMYMDQGQMAGAFPYRAKAIFAFEEIDGTDVCFFGMYVQEYGSDCPPPNTRRVYIAYLDTVHFFHPPEFRSAVYHEILLGYLDYSKQSGFIWAHIWASPPSNGDDYIFHCHPPDQKYLNPEGLQEWYKKMLDKGVRLKIVSCYNDILKQSLKDKITSPKDLPYFEGDHWSKEFEKIIKSLKKDKRTTSPGETSIRKRLFSKLNESKEAFFVIQLHSTQSASSLGPIKDPDPTIFCDLADGRDEFLAWAQYKRHKFSTLANAKSSTMAMLRELRKRIKLEPSSQIQPDPQRALATTPSDARMYEVEEVLGVCKKDNKFFYLIKWRNYDESHNSWQPAENMHCPEALEEFLKGLRNWIR